MEIPNEIQSSHLHIQFIIMRLVLCDRFRDCLVSEVLGGLKGGDLRGVPTTAELL
jgi:hypothetical protein